MALDALLTYCRRADGRPVEEQHAAVLAFLFRSRHFGLCKNVAAFHDRNLSLFDTGFCK
jgi:hypothetical protein